MVKDNIKLTGKLSIKKYNKDGVLVETKEVPNLVVTAGKEFIASRIASNTASPMGYMAIGDDNSATGLGQTSLTNELARVAATPSESGAIITFDATFGPAVGTGALVEGGIFNTDSSNVYSFDGDLDVDDTSDQITITSHGFTAGDQVTYTDGGATAITGLSDEGVYYVIVIDANTIQLASSYNNAIATTPVQINITGTSGTTHKLNYGTMLCRTIFPVINKSAAETVAISWAVTVG